MFNSINPEWRTVQIEGGLGERESKGVRIEIEADRVESVALTRKKQIFEHNYSLRHQHDDRLKREPVDQGLEIKTSVAWNLVGSFYQKLQGFDQQLLEIDPSHVNISNRLFIGLERLLSNTSYSVERSVVSLLEKYMGEMERSIKKSRNEEMISNFERFRLENPVRFRYEAGSLNSLTFHDMWKSFNLLRGKHWDKFVLIRAEGFGSEELRKAAWSQFTDIRARGLEAMLKAKTRSEIATAHDQYLEEMREFLDSHSTHQTSLAYSTRPLNQDLLYKDGVHNYPHRHITVLPQLLDVSQKEAERFLYQADEFRWSQGMQSGFVREKLSERRDPYLQKLDDMFAFAKWVIQNKELPNSPKEASLIKQNALKELYTIIGNLADQVETGVFEGKETGVFYQAVEAAQRDFLRELDAKCDSDYLEDRLAEDKAVAYRGDVQGIRRDVDPKKPPMVFEREASLPTSLFQQSYEWLTTFDVSDMNKIGELVLKVVAWVTALFPLIVFALFAPYHYLFDAKEIEAVKLRRRENLEWEPLPAYL